MKKQTSAIVAVAIIVLVLIGFFVLRTIQPAPISFANLPVNPNEAHLKELENDPSFGLVVRVPTGASENLLGYVGMIAIRDSSQEKSPWRFVPDRRPSQELIQVVPLDEKLYEGIVTRGLSAGGKYTAFTGSLSADEAAEALISNVLLVGHKDQSKIPWDALRRIPMEPGKEYWFIEGAVLSTTRYKKFQKVAAKGELSGVAFSSNGEMYASTQGYTTERHVAFRMFDLRLLRPAEGSSSQPRIHELLRNPELSREAASELMRFLQQESRKRLPAGDDWESPSPQNTQTNASSRIINETNVGFIAPLRQVPTNGCWATVAAMMHSWKVGRAIGVEDFLKHLPDYWSKIYASDAGLQSDEKLRFLRDAGLSFDFGQSYMPKAIEKKLRDEGPLWFTVGTEHGYNSHANLLIGWRESEAGTIYVSYIDPFDGRTHDQEYGEFMRKYQNPAYLFNKLYMKEMVEGSFIPVHVVHY